MGHPDIEELREAERVLSMQIADFEGEEIDPEEQPDLYLPLFAARALWAAWCTRQSISASAEADALREALVWAVEKLPSLGARVATVPLGDSLLKANNELADACTRLRAIAERGVG